MSLEKSSISWSAKQLKNMIANGKIDFDHIIQRSYVWERKRKSALIESMILGYPIPPVFAKRVDDGTGKRGGNIYSIMDGKQRLSTVAQYLNDEFALTELPPVTYMDEGLNTECETDISGMKYSELPEAILGYSFLLVLYESEVRVVNHAEYLVQFQTLNIGNGSCLEQRIEVLTLEGNLLDRHIHHAPCFHNKGDLILIVLRLIGQHIIEQLVRANIEKTLNIATGSEETRFRTQRLTSIETLKQLSFFVLRQIIEVGNREDGAGKLVKKLYTETHMISLVPFFEKALEVGIEVNTMADWLIDFFGSHNEQYDIAAGNGSAKNSNIVVRNTVLAESFEQFFSEV